MYFIVEIRFLLSRASYNQADTTSLVYTLATILLLIGLSGDINKYADDACICGKLGRLYQWWERLCSVGPSYGYFVNALKTWLVTKENLLTDAKQLLVGFGMSDQSLQ